MKFISEGANSKEIIKLLSTKKTLKCAVAFWGESAWKFFKKSNNQVQIICNLESGATNPTLITNLKRKRNIQIKSLSMLHTKVYLTSEKAIVGSSNVSANGLSFEDEETAGWIEASITLTERNILKSIDSWFDKQWRNAHEITNNQLHEAEGKWKLKRNDRLLHKPTNNMSLIEELRNNPYRFRNRNIYFAIFKELASEEAENKFTEVKNNMQSIKKLSYYENCSCTLPEKSFIIDMYYGPRGGFRFYGIYQTPPRHITEKFKYADGGKGEIVICFEASSIMGLKITDKDEKTLKKKVSNLWNSNHAEGDKDMKLISLFDARAIL